MKKYMDIQRIQTKYESAFTVGEQITVTEKVDGANASFTYDKESGKVKAFSRKQELCETNTLRGFWNLTQTFPKEAIEAVTLGGRYVIFGEWLVKHTVSYPDSAYNKFYMFDMWDTVDECWVAHNLVHDAYEMLVALGVNIEFVPIIFTGKFTSWEDLMKYVGTTTLEASPCGEGIVIKSQERFVDTNSRTPIYLKIVAEKFSEVHDTKVRKPVDPTVLAAKAAERELVASIATDRRIDKCLEKLIDEGIVPVDWDEHDMKTIARNLPSAVYADCVKEENDTVIQIENFGKVCGNLTMARVKVLLNSR